MKWHDKTALGPFRLAVGVVVVILAVSQSLKAGPLKDPKRAVDGRTVDLSPLFKWWGKHDGDRPLTAWVHVTGPIVSSSGWGWVVNARVDDPRQGDKSGSNAALVGRQTKILLKNPPLRDQAEFDQLKTRLKELGEQRAQLQKQLNSAAGQSKEVSAEQNTLRQYGVRSRGLSQQAKKSKAAERDATEQLKPVDKEIQEVNTKLGAFPSRDTYEVDCLALDVAQKNNGMSVFDHGAVIK